MKRKESRSVRLCGFGSRLGLLVAILLGAGCAETKPRSSSATTQPGELSPSGDTLQDFANDKVNARFYAKSLKQRLANRPEDLLAAERNYMRAQAAINLWIEDIQNSIKSGRHLDESPRFNEREQRAQAATSEFIRYAEATLHPQYQPKFIGLTEVGQLLLNLTVAKIDKALTEQADRRKKVLAEEAAQFDQYRWESFDTIK